MTKTDIYFSALFSFLGIASLIAVGELTKIMNMPINIIIGSSTGNTITIIITQLNLYAFALLFIIAEYAYCGIKGYKDFKRWDKMMTSLKK